jgi:hypothetical protein
LHGFDVDGVKPVFIRVWVQFIIDSMNQATWLEPGIHERGDDNSAL